MKRSETRNVMAETIEQDGKEGEKMKGKSDEKRRR